MILIAGAMGGLVQLDSEERAEMSDVKLGLWPVAGIVVTAVSVTAAVCLWTRPQADPTADAIKSIFGDEEAWIAAQEQEAADAEQSGETGVFPSKLSSDYDIGWDLNDPPVLSLGAMLRTPAEWDIIGMAGRMDVLKDGAVIWSGAVNHRSLESSRGKYYISHRIQYDDSNPVHRDMRHGPSDRSGTEYTVRLTATHVVFADGTVKTYER